MIINYHHHSPVLFKNGIPYIQSLHGVFLCELAKNVDKLNLFLFENSNTFSQTEDFLIDLPNINVFSLGKKSSLFYRIFRKNSYVKIMSSHLCDFFVVRSPTPLLPAIYKEFTMNTIPLVVGDYKEEITMIRGNFFKRLIIKIWVNIYHYSYKKVLRKSRLVLFNNKFLMEKYSQTVKRSELISTTLVSEKFLFKRYVNFKSLKKIRILYVGRIDYSKGIKEMIDCVDYINKNESTIVSFEIIGWDTTKKENVLNELKTYVKDLNLSDNVIFSGKFSHGIELYEKYRNSNILYLGSKASEGFPRVLWEAMSSSTPVLCTKVGGIPYILDSNHVTFLENLSVEEIRNKIFEIVENEETTNIKITNALELVKNYTIENSVRKILNIIENESC